MSGNARLPACLPACLRSIPREWLCARRSLRPRRHPIFAVMPPPPPLPRPSLACVVYISTRVTTESYDLGGLGSWRLGAWCLGFRMIAAECCRSFFFVRHQQIPLSSFRGGSPHASGDPLPVPPLPGILSLPAERSAQPLTLSQYTYFSIVRVKKKVMMLYQSAQVLSIPKSYLPRYYRRKTDCCQKNLNALLGYTAAQLRLL